MNVWSTPQKLFDKLNKEFQFSVDLCADAGNAKCENWLSRDLSQDWSGEGIGFLNPPFGREIDQWLRKAVETKRIIVAIVPSRTNAPWWHDYVMKAKEIRFVKKKTAFETESGGKGVPPWGTVIVLFYPFGSPGFFSRDRITPECKSWSLE